MGPMTNGILFTRNLSLAQWFYMECYTISISICLHSFGNQYSLIPFQLRRTPLEMVCDVFWSLEKWFNYLLMAKIAIAFSRILRG